MEFIIKVIQSLEISGSFLKGTAEEAINQKRRFLSNFLGPKGDSWIRDNYTDNLKRKNEWYHENS